MKGDSGLRGPVRKALLPFLILGTLILVIHAFLTLIRREPVIYWEWPHPHEAAEWKISPGIRLDKETEGGLAGTIRSSLASLDIPAFHNFPATAEDVMEIKLKVAGIDYEGEENRAIWRKRGWFIHWLNDKEVAWSKDRRTSFYPYQDEAWHTYMIPLGQEPGWRGNISSIQLILQRIEGSRFSLSSVRLGRHLPAPHLLSRVSGAVFSALSRGRYFYFPLFLLLLIYPLLLDAGKTRWIPLFVFCLAFVIRILFILDPSLDGMVIGDQARMDFAAQKIVAGKDLMGDVFWPPVWQYTLAFLYLFFGHSYLAVRIFLACVSAVACLVVFQLGKEIMGEKAGYLAGLLLALSAGPIFYSGFLFADSLNAALTVASFLLLHYALKPGASIATLILTGMLFGVTALTRSEIAGFLPVIFFLYYVTCRR